MVAVGSLCARTGQSISVQDAAQGHLLLTWPAEISSTLDTTFGTKMGLENQHVNAGCPMFVPAQPIALAENTIGRQPQNGGNGDGFTDGGPMYTLNATGVHGVAQAVYEMHGQNSRVRDLGDTCSTVTSKWGTGGGNVPVTTKHMAVRRLMPKECERLQGFPDNYTDIQPKGKPTPDGPRYKALGNSMAVPVMRWIGERIQKVEQLNVS
jgi:DNA (cytosine-5)-methyltransferase 1